MPRLRKYGVATTIDFALYLADGTGLQSAATFAAGDVTIRKDGGADTNIGTLPTDEGKTYSVPLTATEMQAERIVIQIVDVAGAAWLDHVIIIETYGHASAEHAFDLDTAAEAMRGTDSAALASVCTESRLAELDAANLPTDLDAVLVDTGTTIPALLPAALVGGRMDSSVGALANDVITPAVFATGAIDAAALENSCIDSTKIAAGAIGNVQIATGAIREDELFSTAIDKIRDGILAGTITELTSIPAASPTLTQAVSLAFMALRNRVDVNKTLLTKEIHNDAGTVLATKALTDDGTEYSEAKMS